MLGSKPDLRSALLDAGEELIRERGLEAVNTNEIARAAGVGVGTFYKHFRDKRALHEALALRAWEELGAILTRVAPATLAAPAEAREMTRALVAYATRRPGRIRIVARALAGLGPGSPVSLSLRPFERRLQLRQTRGEIDDTIDAVLIARSWWSLIGGTLLWWVDQPERAAAEDLAELLVRLHPASTLARARGGVSRDGPPSRRSPARGRHPGGP